MILKKLLFQANILIITFFYGRKWSLYEWGIRMPFIISWKGNVPKGNIDSRSILSSIDLFPSLCSMVGIIPPNNLDGINKADAFLGNPISNVVPTMWEYNSYPGGSLKPGNKNYISPSFAIRSKEWKLLINEDSTDIQLYNLLSDPCETNILANKKSIITHELSKTFLNWSRSMPIEIASN